MASWGYICDRVKLWKLQYLSVILVNLCIKVIAGHRSHRPPVAFLHRTSLNKVLLVAWWQETWAVLWPICGELHVGCHYPWWLPSSTEAAIIKWEFPCAPCRFLSVNQNSENELSEAKLTRLLACPPPCLRVYVYLSWQYFSGLVTSWWEVTHAGWQAWCPVNHQLLTNY